HKKREETQTILNAMTYDIARSQELWTKILRDSVGATSLMRLLPFGTQLPVEEVKDAMKEKGFIGARFHRAKRLAGVTASMPDGGELSLCQNLVGLPQLYERVDSRKKPEPIINFEEVIRGFFAQGPLLVQQYNKALKAKEYSRDTGAVVRAQRKMGF